MAGGECHGRADAADPAPGPGGVHVSGTGRFVLFFCAVLFSGPGRLRVLAVLVVVHGVGVLGGGQALRAVVPADDGAGAAFGPYFG